MDLTQNEKEWYEWRLRGIGASDAPIIMGKSKYMTKLELWDQKFKKEPPKPEDMEPNFIQKKGHRLEAWARPGIEFSTGLTWKPALFEHKSFPFIRASLDGWNPEALEVWECKYMGKDLWNALADESKHLSERIPVQYFDQLMQQFFVTGAKKIHLTGVKEEKIDEVKQLKQYTLTIDRLPEFEEYINRTLAPELFSFWKSVQDGKRPEPNDGQDVVSIDNEELKELILNYQGLKNQEKELAKALEKEKKRIMGDVPDQVKKIKDAIYSHEARNYDKMELDGIKLTMKRGKESVDFQAAFDAFVNWMQKLKTANYQDIVKAVTEFPDSPNLEKYTTAGKPSLAITFPKEKKEKEEPKKQVQKPKEKLKEWSEMSPEEQEIQAKSNAFKNPETDKKPRGWDKKNRAERIKYLRTHAKKASEPAQKAMNALADELEKLG